MAAGEKDPGSGSHHRPIPKSGEHYLAKYVLRGSAVLQAVRGHLRSPISDDIVFGKETSFELLTINEDGIVQSICEQPVFGIIKDLVILGWNDKFRQSRPQMVGKDLLVVLSDSGKLSFLAFSHEMHRFFALHHIQLSKPGNSIHHIGRMLAADPDGSFIAASAFEDRFALFSMSTCAGDNLIDEKMFYPPEHKGDSSFAKDSMRANIRGTIWSMCFVSHSADDHSSKEFYPLLATIMHRKARLRNELLLFGCNIRTHSIQFVSSCPEAEIGPLALNIAAVPHLSRFAVAFRMGDALLINFRDPYCMQCVQRINFGFPIGIEEPDSFHESSRGMDIDDEGMSNVAVSALLELSDSAAAMTKDDDPMSIDNGIETASTSRHVCACSWEPSGSDGANLIICLDAGELYILEIRFTMDGIRANLSDCLYRCMPFKELVWLKGGFVIGLVEMGDGLVLKLDDEGRLLYKNSIQNVAPILDLAVVDVHDDEKQDQMFSCCGMNPMGSLRVIRTGLCVEKLVKTPPIYQGITGTWTLRLKRSDSYHSFLVLSFVEETRILSVGLSFFDVTDATGFQPDVCTLACGLVSDGILVQIHRAGVRLCSIATACPNEFAPSMPFCTSWCPDNMSISSGAVGHNAVVVATSNPCNLFVLGVKSLSATHQIELYEIQHLRLQHEVSCISIPEQEIDIERISSSDHLIERDDRGASDGVLLTFVIGTHTPSVEVLSFSHDRGFRFLATGLIVADNALGVPLSTCIPENVRLVLVDRLYVLAGLRNGMLLRYEWPQKPLSSSSFYCFATKLGSFRSVQLQLIAVRRLGIAPVVLVPLRDALNADVIALSETPWLLLVARHSIAYTSISFQPATHTTSVSFLDCPNGILFVADNSLHLLELHHSKRINARKLSIEGTPRKVLYHKESKTLLILRTGLRDASFSSDVCRVDPFSGVVISKFPCEPGETAKCMQMMKVGYQNLLIVGTSQCSGRTIMPSGEAESAKGRLIILSLDCVQTASESSLMPQYSNFEHNASSPDESSISDGVKIDEMKAGQLRVIYQNQLSGAVLAICSFLNRYILASAGNILNVFCFVTDNPLRLRKHSMAKTRFTITSLTTCFSRIAVGDCRDGILFYSYTDDIRKLEQLYSDPVQRLVADCTLLNMNTAVASDRRGSISILSNIEDSDGVDCPEKNLLVNCSFYMGESVMSIQKGLFSYRSSVNGMDDSNGSSSVGKPLNNSVIASTLLGSVLILIPVTSEEHQLLEAVQAKLVVHPLTAPVLGNDHKEFRQRGSQAGVPVMLDGDMLIQFLELTIMQQETVLALPKLESHNTSTSDSHQSPSVNQVLQVLERIHHALA